MFATVHSLIINFLLLFRVLVICDDCIFLEDCPEAVKHFNHILNTQSINNNTSTEILRKAHCGFGQNENGKSEPKVICEKVSNFIDDTIPTPRKSDGCIFLEDCPEAVKHFNHILNTQSINNNTSTEILRKAHCGFGQNENGKSEPKVICEKVSNFIDDTIPTPRKSDGCIFLEDCPEAVKHFNHILNTQSINNNTSTEILRKAHCGFGQNRNGKREPKVICEKVSYFIDDTKPTLRKSDGCIFLEDCPEALRHLNHILNRQSINTTSTTILRKAHCGYGKRKIGKKEPKVICYKISRFVENNSIVTPRIEDLAEKMKLLPSLDMCGLQPVSMKIYSGYKAELDDFPWLALIKYKSLSGKISFGCHGTLINPKYVITAAHCIYPKNRKLYSVILGEYDIRYDKDCVATSFGSEQECNEPVKIFGIEKSIIHSNFTNTVHNDIGLIRLNDSVNYSDFIQPICLPTLPLILHSREKLLISGWGKTETESMSNIKLIASTTLSDRCFELYGPLKLGEGQICTEAHHGDFCDGDSGGPLMALRKGNNAFLAGIVSANIRCGAVASIYTNVSYYIGWILSNIEE